MIGINSPCNGDAWDADGLDGKTWQNWHKFRLGQRSVDKRDPKWGAFGSDGDGLGSLGAWIFGGDTNLFDRRDIARRDAKQYESARDHEISRDQLLDLAAQMGFPGYKDPINKREADPKWGAFGSNGDGLGSLGAWIFGGDTNLFDRRAVNKREADPKWGAFGSNGDGLGALGAWIFGGDTNLFDKREAQPAAWIVEEAKRDAAMYGICQVGVKSACNGDAWDGDGLTGKTWEDYLGGRLRN